MHLVLSLFAAAVVSAHAPACAQRLPRAPAGLPAPVVVTTGCAAFAIQPDGSVSAAALPPVHDAPPRTDGQATLVRGGRIVWRSANRYRLYDVVLRAGPRVIALGYHARLYLAPHGGPERLVGRGLPLAWTRRGTLLALRFRGRRTEIEVRDAAGRRLRVLARDVGSYVMDSSSGTLLYLDRNGFLVRSDGRFRTRLRRMGPAVWAEPLAEGLIAVRDVHRLAVLRWDGTLVGRVRFRGRSVAVAAGAPPVAGRGGVAFTVTHGYSGYRTRGVEEVDVLRPGGSVVRLLRRRLRFALCARGGELSWHGRWLLYHATEGAVVAVDTATGRSVDLGRVATRLPGYVVDPEGAAGVRARWAGPLGAPAV
jgi:hypothetical protein